MNSLSSSSHPEVDHGLQTLASAHAFAETVQRLLVTFAEHRIKVFVVIDQQAEAAAAGLGMPPMTLIVFGNPVAGTPLLIANPACGIDLPLKVLVTESAPGEVLVRFNVAAYLIERHGLPDAMASHLIPPQRLIAAALAGCG